jgi:hypothetical protein
MVKVYGDGLDALVSINLLLKSGFEVAHYSKTEMPGGHFRGKTYCGADSDIGMVLLEPDYKSLQSMKMENYDGEFGRTSRMYLGEVFSWLETQIGDLYSHSVLAELPSGIEVPDYFIRDRLDFLDSLDHDQRVELQERLLSILRSTPVDSPTHPSNRMTSSYLSEVSLVGVLKELLGESIFREYFEGFIDKVTGTKSPLISSRDNRRIWLPNYYPESLYYFLSRDLNFKNYELRGLDFLRPNEGQIAEFVARLDLENCRSDKYKRLEFLESYKSFDYTEKDSLFFVSLNDFSKDKNFESDFIREFCSDSAKDTNIISNSIQITHFCVSETDLKTVFIPDASNPVFRYSIYSTNQNFVASIESQSNQNFNLEDALTFVETHNLEALCEGRKSDLQLKLRKTCFSESEWFGFLSKVKERIPHLNENVYIVHPEANSFNDNLLRGMVAFRKWVS